MMAFVRSSKWAGVCILTFAFSLCSCSIPNLETAACTESRNAVREFYSYHFGNSMTFTLDDLKIREKFLTPAFFEKLKSAAEGTDPFTTGTTDLPKAFRVGECKEAAPERTTLQVLLIWRDDNRTEERNIRVEAQRQGDKWLIDNVATH